jgi:cellulose synthase (UDP-forming)
MATSPVSSKTASKFFNIRTRIKKNTLLFRYLAEINIIVGAWYIQWRIFHSLNYGVLWLAVPLLIAEIYSYIGGVIFTIGLWRPLVRDVRSFNQMLPAIPECDYPKIDLFVTCYNEPVDIVEETIRAALALDYPANKLRVYVLDDGNSADMRSMSENLGLEDLESPMLQAELKKVRTEKSDLIDQLEQVSHLILDAERVEIHLKNQPQSGSDNLEVRLLQSLRQSTIVLDPDNNTVYDRLIAERDRIQVAIHQKEFDIDEMTRCRYIARPKPAGKPHHAKAGNINYALFSGGTTGEFIVTLDADHLLKPQFLMRVLPYFYDYNPWTGNYDTNRVAFVQTPQDFYNLPPGDPFGQSAHLFYGPIQQGKDGLNSAFYTGTDALIRREALVSVGLSHFSEAYRKDENRLDEFELIGGVSSTSITEDMNTAMRMHAAGWKSVYHDELLALGLAPNDLNSMLGQRLRWAQGTLQVMLGENPIQKKGLTFWQKLQYFQTMYSYFSGFSTVIFIACPIIYFFSGLVPMNADAYEFALHFVPVFILNRLTLIVATWGIPAREIWRSEQYAIALFPVFIQAVWSVFSKGSLNFKVTPKRRQAGIYLHLVIPQLIVFGLTIAGMMWSIYQFVTGQLTNPWVHIINAFWAIYNLSLLFAIVRASVWQPKEGANLDLKLG